MSIIDLVISRMMQCFRAKMWPYVLEPEDRPSFGLRFLNLYGSPKEFSELPNEFEDINNGKGLHSRLITEGFELASNKALEVLEVVKVMHVIDHDALIQVARTSPRTKVHQELALTELDEAKRPEDHNKEDPDNQPDVKSEESAIEMSEDFDAKAQDLEDVDKEKDNEEDDGGDEEEIDKQMGEVDDMDNDKLDEQMWGSDLEDNGDEEEKEEESGPGDGKQSEPELVAKDDNAYKSENDKDREQGNKDETEEEENDDKQKQNNLDNLDQDTYDDDQIDPYHGKQEEQQAPDDFDLPDDLNFDDDNDDGGKDDEKEMEETGQEMEDDTALPPEDSPENAEDEQKVETEDKHEQETGEDGEDKGEETNEEEKTNDGADTADNDERQEQDGEDDPGFTPQKYMGKRHFKLHAAFLNATMVSAIDAPVEFEVSIGNYGNKLDYYTLPCTSTTQPTNAVFDDTQYNFQPLGGIKPCVVVDSEWEDIAWRLEALNFFEGIIAALESNIEQVKVGIKAKLPTPELAQLLISALDQLVEDCKKPLPTPKKGTHLSTELDTWLTTNRQYEMETLIEKATNLRENATDIIIALSEAENFKKILHNLAVEPQNSMPDVIIWMISGEKRIAYYRIPAHTLLYSKNPLYCGRECGNIQTIQMKYPGHKQENKHDVPALLRIKLWLGLQSEEDAWHQMQKEGEMAVFAETYENQQEVPTPSWQWEGEWYINPELSMRQPGTNWVESTRPWSNVEPYFWDYSYMNITEPAGDLYLTPVTPRPYMFPETDEVFCDSPGAAVSLDFIPYTCPPAGYLYYLGTEEADSVFHPNCYSPGCESPRLPLRNMQCWLYATPPHVDQVLPYSATHNE